MQNQSKNVITFDTQLKTALPIIINCLCKHYVPQHRAPYFQIKMPSASDVLSSLKAQQICGGSKSLFAVTMEGRVFACGESTNGRLGLGPMSGNVLVPRQIDALSQFVVKKVAVHSGGRHAMAITIEGKLFSWGEGEDGKLGHGNKM